ncbi:MAG: motility protein A, partial [Lachnospiraceae bacterium]|nr:motility protein A [Lachnospiraceae bacterium]
MDIASLVGIAMGVVMVLFGIISSGASITSYIDVPSVIITIGGSLTSTLTTMKLPDFINGLKSGFSSAIKEPANADPKAIIGSILDMANVARKEGLLALEESAGSIEDEFLKKGIMLV